MGCKLIPVDNDVQGLRPDKLREALAPWSPADTKDPKSGIPRVLYTVPNGANPTGFSLDTERKREILEVNRIDLIDKSHSAPVPYRTMHHSVQKCVWNMYIILPVVSQEICTQLVASWIVLCFGNGQFY